MNRAVVLRTTLGPRRGTCSRSDADGARRAASSSATTAAAWAASSPRTPRACSPRSASRRASTPRPVPTPLARVRREAPRRRRGRDGHREPQPARVQRLQGLLGERRADHPAARRGHRRRDRARRPRRRRPAACRSPRRSAQGPRRDASATTSSDATSPRCAQARASAATAIARIAHRLHAAARRRATASPRAALAEAASPTSRPCPSRPSRTATFPTVAFPNPEEKGAIDLAFALARSARRAARPRQRSRRRPPRRRGARIRPAALRAAHRQPGRRAARPLPAHRGPARATSALRARLARLVADARRIAATLGVRYEETLTGFKWIANRAMELETRGRARASSSASRRRSATRVGTLVRDKDGISAALLVAEIAAVLRAAGQDAARRARRALPRATVSS